MSVEERAKQERLARDRLEILDAIAAAQERFSEVSRATADAPNKRAAITAIGALLSVSDVAARAVTELPWHRLCGDSRRQTRADRDDVLAYLHSIEA